MNNGATQSIEIQIENGYYECHGKGCRTDTRKITSYLLKPGTHHYQEFIDVGYTDDDCEKLFADIAGNYLEELRIEETVTPFGATSFSIMMELGVTEKRTFRTVWERKKTDEMAKLITAYRDRRLE